MLCFFKNNVFFQHNQDQDTSPLISFVPNFDENHVSPMKTTKPILVYERHRRENTNVHEPPYNIISSTHDPDPAPIPLR